jgi:LPS-assembly lipoprotein
MRARAFPFLLIVFAMLLSGCGFHLRGAGDTSGLPFKTVYIGLPQNSPLGIELRRNIRASGNTEIVTDPKQAEAVLEILSETRDRAILSLNSQGRVREYSLFYRLNFRVKDTAGQELLPATNIILKRDVSFNESQVIAKEKEEEMLYRDMQKDLVQQILRRMSALKTP